MLLLLCLNGPARALEWAHQPSSGAQVTSFRPEVALYFPPGTPLAYGQARMFLDQREVTADCVRTGLFISYRPSEPLQRGRHEVRVEVGEIRQHWEFEVVGSKLISGCVFSAPPLPKAFDKVKVEMRGEKGGKAWAQLVGYPEKYPLTEKRGLYRGEFKIPAKLAGASAPVELFLEYDGQLDRQLCEGQLAIAAQNLTVEWVSPEHGATVEKTLRACGKTLPECQVEVFIKLFFRDGVEFGKLPPDSKKIVKADESGNFAFDFSFPQGLQRLGVSFTAVARDANDNVSKPAGLLLYQGRSGGLPPLRTDLPLR